MSFNTRLTIEEFDRMVAVGAFEKGMYRDWVELIDGVIRYMGSIGLLNEVVIERLTSWSFKGPAEDAVGIRVKSTVELTESNCVLLPDIAWVRNRRYWKKCPTANDVLLIIEVADSSVCYDQGKKADLYAAAEIPDYWVVNLLEPCVRIRRAPRSGQFQRVETIGIEGTARPLAFPEQALRVSSLFPRWRESR